MPRYFFNVKNHTDAEDLIGLDLPDLKAAIGEARKDIADIKRARFDTVGDQWPRWSIEICDKNRLMLRVVPFSSN